MKQMKTLMLAGLLAMASVTGFAQTTQKLSAGKINEYGLIYSLPVTVIDVTVEAEKTVETPGEFYKYAGKYLGLTPITRQSTSWKLTSAKAVARGVADESERYLVQFKSGSTPYIMVDANGMPLSVNTDKILAVPAVDMPEAVAPKPTILQQPVAREAMTEEMLKSQSTAKRAELAAQRIFELRQTRNEIIAGQAENMPGDGKAMQLALDNLSRQEEALTAMFVGTVQKSSDVQTFSITPDSLGASIVFARLSVLDGIVDADDLSGDPIEVNIEVVSRGELPVNEKGEVKRFPKGGLAYRVPGVACVSVGSMGRVLYDDDMEVAQYGVVFGLDPGLFTDKKAPAYAVFSPVTGAVREIGTVGQ